MKNEIKESVLRPKTTVSKMEIDHFGGNEFISCFKQLRPQLHPAQSIRQQ